MVQRSLHLGAGGVTAGMDDAAARVPALPGQRPSSRLGLVETRSVVDQFARRRGSRRPRSSAPHPGRTARHLRQSCRRRGRRSSRRCPAAPPRCRPARRTSRFPGGLAQHHHLAAATVCGQGGDQAGDPGADDHHVGSLMPHRCRRPSGAGLIPRRRAADLDHPLHAGPGPCGDVGIDVDLVGAFDQAAQQRGRRDHLHVLARRPVVDGAEVDFRCGAAQLVQHADLGGDQHLTGLRLAGGVQHAAGGQDLHPVLGERALTGEIQSRSRTTAFGMHDTARHRDARAPCRPARRR